MYLTNHANKTTISSSLRHRHPQHTHVLIIHANQATTQNKPKKTTRHAKQYNIFGALSISRVHRGGVCSGSSTNCRKRAQFLLRIKNVRGRNNIFGAFSFFLSWPPVWASFYLHGHKSKICVQVSPGIELRPGFSGNRITKGRRTKNQEEERKTRRSVTSNVNNNTLKHI